MPIATFVSVSRSFECEIATPAFKNRHKIATQKFLKIATFLAQIATFVSNNVEKWSSFYFHCIFMWQSFWKMWHFRRKSGILSWQNQIDGVYTQKNTKIMGFYALKKSPLEKNWSPLDPKNRHGGDKSPLLDTLLFFLWIRDRIIKHELKNQNYLIFFIGPIWLIVQVCLLKSI